MAQSLDPLQSFNLASREIMIDLLSLYFDSYSKRIFSQDSSLRIKNIGHKTIVL